MVDRDLVWARLAQVAEHVSRVRAHQPKAVGDLADDLDRRDLVAFNLMLAVQDCADVASHIITDEGFGAPTTLGDLFRTLGNHGVLTPSVAEAMARSTGLRNVVVHAYGRLDIAMLFAGATRGIDDIDAFCRDVAAWVRDRPR